MFYLAPLIHHVMRNRFLAGPFSFLLPSIAWWIRTWIEIPLSGTGGSLASSVECIAGVVGLNTIQWMDEELRAVLRLLC